MPSVTTTFYTDGATTTAREAELDGLSYRTLREAVECDRVPEGEVVAAETLGDGVVLLRVRRFVRDTGRRVFNALRGLTPEELWIDLRGNAGGAAEAAIDLADDFLDDGCVIAIRRQRGDDVIHRARGPRSHDFAVVLLVDGGTASAAELFAGALQSQGRALVLGAPTAGKGSAQQIQTRRDGEGVTYATIAEYLLADGQRIHDAGITPDRLVEDGDPVAMARALSGSAGARRPAGALRPHPASSEG